MRKKLVEWFHDSLGHAGTDGLYRTIAQHFYWKGLKQQISECAKICPDCQYHEIAAQKKYGKLDVKSQADKLIPWDVFRADAIRPWPVHLEDKEKGEVIIKEVKAMTMIDECLGWPEIKRIAGEGSGTAYEMSQILGREWFCRHLRPNKVAHNNSSEFTGQEFQEMLESHRAKS